MPHAPSSPAPLILLTLTDDGGGGVAATLGASGFRTARARDAAALLRRCEGADPPALVLLDLALPPTGGLHALRALDDLAAAPLVVAVVGASDTRGAAIALQGGAAACLVKPLVGDAVAGVVEAVLTAGRVNAG